jgi:hypothetical protein
LTCALICFPLTIFLTESLYRKLYIPFDAARFTLHGFAVESYKQTREGRFLCLCVHVRMWCESIDYLRPTEAPRSLSRESLPTPCMARSCEADLLLRVERVPNLARSGSGKMELPLARTGTPDASSAMFAWLISHQPTVLFSQNKPATINQSAVLFSHNKPAPAISHQPNEHALG